MSDPKTNESAASAGDSLRAAHSMELGQLAAALGSDTEMGLAEAQVADLRAAHGSNQLAQAPPIPLWRRLLGQFKDLVIWILIVAAVIAAVMGEVTDAVAILAIVLLNGIIGFVQEEKAERALAALRNMSSPMAKVLRGGAIQQIPAADLVPGDRIELEAGDHVPADARLISAFSLQVQEAALTGESTAAEKDAAAVLPPETSLGDRRNMVYQGTVASTGKASAIVVATGMKTELGRIAGLLARQTRELTPLQRRLAELGRVLVVVCLVLVAIVFVLQLRRGGDLFQVFLVSVSLAVAAVPEGLPAVVTLALALGLQRMAARHALVRKLPSVETLGSVTVVCTDKTGTLTRNEMTVRTVIAGDREFHVSGSGYKPEGRFHLATPSASSSHDDGSASNAPEAAPVSNEAINAADYPDLRLLLTAAARCNSARLVRSGDQQDAWQVIGDPTEGALLVTAMKAGIDTTRNDFQLISEIPFDSNRKAMSVISKETDGSEVIYTKGAPEVVLAMCNRQIHDERERPLTDEIRQRILRKNAALADQALRVLALAYRRRGADGNELKEAELVLAGLAGMIDPPREEAKPAVESCHSAGIRPIMITGDHPATARAIASELGILSAKDGVMTGQELENASDDELIAKVEQISVYARVSAEHKLRVVKAWQRRGEIVAMTGDGVNDAPAIKTADIGIAMGIAGTDVTKEASDMVLTDDNFRSIVNAVEEGRCIFDNIQNIVHYLLACNAGEVLFMFSAAAAGWPLPLAAIQILWINLVTDGLPALALALEPPDQGVMQRPPRPPHEPVLTLRRAWRIVFHGALVATATAIGFWLIYQGRAERLDQARTVAFCILAFAQLFFSFACRSERYTLLQLGLFTNRYLLAAILLSGLLQLSVVLLPFVRHFFEVPAALPGSEWLLILLLALAPVTVVELVKLLLVTLLPAPSRRHVRQ
jgi:P-type Ca2+ transporter type 2C